MPRPRIAGTAAALLPWLAAAALAARSSAADLALAAGDFSLEFGQGRIVRRADLASAGSSADGGRLFSAKDHSFSVAEKTVDEEEVNCRRAFVTVANTGPGELPLTRVVLLDAPAPPGARVAGSVSGSPIVIGETFVGVEYPFAENQIVNGRLRCAQPIMHPLRPGETVTVSDVIGAAKEPSQLRRAFLAYLEHERPRPYAPFLTHNTWYNLGGLGSDGKRFSEADELGIIAALGRELVERRGVKLDGFALDDGWDDPHTLWRFNPGWPDGLKKMAAAAAKFGAAPGIWLSPWGGYGKPKKARLAAAAPEGFEIRNGSFSLAGPRYYDRFRELCVGAVRDDGVAFFKFDGIGAKSTGVIDPAAGRDFDAMLRLEHELRALRPELYISQTTGTWASPWWLLHVDNIWRGGHDHDFAGVGTDRQRWITYRDAATYENVVRKGPLFPLNSVMLHDIIYARLADRLATDPGDDFSSQVRSFFGTGTQLQELYLSPQLLTPKNWDDLAAAAKWSRANAPILRDTHWIGGDPGRLETYGWAAWAPAKGIVTLRNPSDKPAIFLLEAKAVFELPSAAANDFRVTSPYPDTPAPVAELRSGLPVEILLRPFEVLVIEATPKEP